MDIIQQYLPLIAPLVLIQIGLMLFCLWDLAHRQTTRGPRWFWAIVIIIGELLGPVLYLLVGRQEA